MTSSQRRLAGFVAGFPSASIADEARNLSRQSLLDSLAVSYAGGGEPAVRFASDYTASMQQTGGAAGWLTGELYLPEAAALLNAVAAHALDYDDVTPAWRGHPGAVIWPALFAVAALKQSTFGKLVDAYVLGFEVGAQIGANITAHHYGAGWHATSTIGVIAAAAACSRALKLDARQTSNALGLAIAQSAGVQSNFGSMAKPFQAGFASSAAVRAALLAMGGVQAANDALEGSAGFSALYGATEEIRLELPGPASFPAAIVRHGVEVKQFPNCYATHRAVEAALSLRQQIAGAADQITYVLVEGSCGAHQPLLPGMPATPDEARFSIEFAVACALVDGAIRLASFTSEALERPAVRRLISLTQVRESSELGPKRTARVTIELADGSRRTQAIASLPGTFGETAYMRRLAEKVADCMAQAGLHQWAETLCDEVLTASSDSDLHRMDTPVFRAIFSARQHSTPT